MTAAILAVAALLARHWPEKGTEIRNETSMAVAGVCLRAGVEPHDVVRLLKVVAKEAGDEEWSLRGGCVHNTAERLEQGKDVTGLPKLGELLGEDVTKKIGDWLGLSGADGFLVLNPGAPFDVARKLLDLHFDDDGVRTLHFYRGNWYRWNDAHYAEVEPVAMDALLYSFMDGALRPDDKGVPVPLKPTKADVERVLHALKARALVSQEHETPCWLDETETDLEPHDMISFADCVLNVENGEPFRHDPVLFAVNSLPFDYDPGAPKPVGWDAFLKSIWADDKESRGCLQEIFGYCLTRDTRQQKIFLIVGPTRSGKGTIARTLRVLLGKGNTVGPTLHSLGTNFGLWPLIDKQLAVVSDARLSARSNQQAVVERLLSISGEDALTVDRKNKSHWTGQLGVRLLILSNELPAIRDISGALANRFVPLMLTESFLGREDLELDQRIQAELPGIMNWSLRGLKRLRKRGYFAVPQSSKEAQADLEELASPVRAFIRERCDLGPGHRVDVDELYKEWQDWCELRGRKPGPANIFGRDLHTAVPGLKTRQKHGGARFYEGLGLA